LREVCDNVLADATIARDKAQLRAVALQMLGEAYMNVKKDTPSSNPIVNGSVPEESEYVRIDTKGSRAREGRSWIVPWCDSCQGYLSARTRGIRPLLDPTIFTSLHYHSRKLFEHQSNLILWPLFVQTVNNIHKSFDGELVSAARNIRCIIEKVAENLVTEIYPGITGITWLVSQLRATCYRCLWYIFALVKTDLQTGYPVISWNAAIEIET